MRRWTLDVEREEQPMKREHVDVVPRPDGAPSLGAEKTPRKTRADLSSRLGCVSKGLINKAFTTTRRGETCQNGSSNRSVSFRFVPFCAASCRLVPLRAVWFRFVPSGRRRMLEVGPAVSESYGPRRCGVHENGHKTRIPQTSCCLSELLSVFLCVLCDLCGYSVLPYPPGPQSLRNMLFIGRDVDTIRVKPRCAKTGYRVRI